MLIREQALIDYSCADNFETKPLVHVKRPRPQDRQREIPIAPNNDGDVWTELDASVDASRPPSAKRRKVSPPKERITEYLDLTKPNSEFSPEECRLMERLVMALREKKNIVVIAGAGISVSAGIPDFSSSTGIFTTVKSEHKFKGSGKQLFDASVYQHDASTQAFHAMVREMAQTSKSAKPTPFHHLLASLAGEGRLLPFGHKCLPQPQGPWPATIQLHGGLEKMVCTKCGQLEPFDGEVFDGSETPLCRTCEVDDGSRINRGRRSQGIGGLRPRFVLYNEYNPDEEAIGNVSGADLKTRPDAAVVVGTTLKVPGTRRLAKEMCNAAHGRRNGLTVWINGDSEPKGADVKDCWDIVVRSECDHVAQIVALPPWDCTIGEDCSMSQEEDRESQGRRSNSTSDLTNSNIEPQIAAKLGQVEQIQGIPTPSPSPEIVKRPGYTNQCSPARTENQDNRGRVRQSKQPAKLKPKRLVYQIGKILEAQIRDEGLSILKPHILLSPCNCITNMA
ncbi:DHS-like NAD/FAD-binding domain-containing protein [Ilyonectria destructans]|nr:DHS-like NAD/FAD-binding domain-containing protein [Ilyonectria destructans]